MKKNFKSYLYDASCDWYIRRTVSDGKLVREDCLPYYYGHTSIPAAGGLTNKPQPVTILYRKLFGD